MNPEESHTEKSRIFYGWFALAGVAIVIFIVGGSFVHSFGPLLPELINEYEWSRAEVALALTLGILAFGLPSPLFGILVNKYGPKFTIVVGNAIAALGLAGVFLAQEVWHLYFFYIIAGLGGGFGGYIACTAIINNWFIRRRSLALGIFQSFAGLGGFVFPPLTTGLIAAIDWRASWLVLAGIILVIPVLIGGIFLLRNKPEDMGLVPDGMPADAFLEYEKSRPDSSTDTDKSSWGIKKVLKARTPWLIGGFAAANSYTVGTMVTHQIAYLEDIGFTPMTAASTLSVMSIFSLIGSLGFGFLALRTNIRYLASLAFIIQIIALIILLTTKELALLYLFAIFLGLSTGSLTVALAMFVGAYYPRERYAQVLGVVFPFQVISNAVAATIAGLVFDATKSYTPAFIAASVFSLAGLFFAFFANRPKQP
ncbi:MAG TPA: MFS transporter [Dehalococcoidia bacterium]|nr:MFS transporter [Dehalococcoidia bacterium]